MGSLTSQLLPREVKDLRAFEKAGGARLPFAGEVAARWHQVRRETAGLLDQLAPMHPTWTADQLAFAAAVDRLGQLVGGTWAVYRRLLRDDPAELAAGLCLADRLTWVKKRVDEQSGMGVSEDDTAWVEPALGAGDHEFARRTAASHPVRRRSEFNELVRLATRAVYARDPAALAEVGRRLRALKADKHLRPLRDGLLGLCEHDGQAVVNRVEFLLAEATKWRKRAGGRVIAVEAHNYYRLAEWLSPDLAPGYDSPPPLPWDAAFHDRTGAHPDPLAGTDLRPASEELHAAAIDLTMPAWFRPITEPELALDECEVVLTEMGPKRAEVAGKVKIYTTARPQPVPDLAAGVPLRLIVVPRASAQMVRIDLGRVGAVAEVRLLRRVDFGSE